MQRVVVSTSTSCLDYLGKPRNVHMLRMHININDKDYIDGQDLSTDELVQQMDENPESLPTTRPPSEEEVGDFFYDLLSKGCQEVFVVCASSKQSDTYQHIQNITGLFASHMTIHLFDSKALAYPEGLLALEASKMMSDDKSAFEIERRLTKMRDSMSIYLVVEDLRNMIRTKRISAPAGFIANLFGIKPLLEMNDKGEIVPIEKVRGIEKALMQMCDTILEQIKSHADKDKISLFIMIAGSKEGRLSDFVKAYMGEHGYPNLKVVPITSVSVALIGTSAVGIGSVVLD